MTWPMKRLRYLATFNPSVPASVRADAEGSYPLLPMDSINEFTETGAPEVRPVGDLLNGYSYLEPTDVAYAKVTPCFENGKGLVGSVLDGPTFATTEITVLRPHTSVNQRFLGYLLQSSAFRHEAIASMTGAGGLKRVSEVAMRDLRVPAPPLEEQKLIADYLDRETAEIDAFMVDCSSMVTLLEEQELALEASLLTRGLNSSVSVIKDHGILWLEGESIPTHWTRMKLGFLLRMKSGDAISSEDIEAEGPYPVFGGGGFRGYTSTWNITGSHVLIGRQGALCGKVFVSAGDAFATEHAIVTYPKIDLDLRWLEGLLRFMNLGQYSQSAAQPGIGVESISKLYVPVPPLSEQAEIGASLADHQAKRSSLLLELQSAITLAHERRGALISAAVTGQIDVSTEGMSAAEQLRDDLEVHL